MNKTANSSLTRNSRSLRKNMTQEERRLWHTFLKALPLTFNRQKVMGKYILDFYCASKKIAVELDGSQHYEDGGIEYDSVRDEFLRSLGITVLRYSNKDINQNFKRVCEDILAHLT